MNKPLGFYTSYIPGDDSYLEELQEQYGTCLQKLTRREKLFLLNSITSYMCCHEPGDISGEVVTTSYSVVKRLTDSDKEGMIEALISQIRWGNDAET